MPMNMSYCRWENTVAAMRECLESYAYFNDGAGLSECEKKAYDQFLRLCVKVVGETWIEELGG